MIPFAELPDMVRAAAANTVAEFDRFDDDNDRHEEHEGDIAVDITLYFGTKHNLSDNFNKLSLGGTKVDRLADRPSV